MAIVDISIDEVIALLKRTSLPTIIVEGKNDVIVYRKFEKTLAYTGVSVLPIGGRNKILEVFKRINEIPANIKLAFIIDQDIWVITGIPNEYNDNRIITTYGYSIENDIFIDGNLIDILQGEEITNFKSDLEKFIKWYALALHRHISDPSQKICSHPSKVLDHVQYCSFTCLKSGEVYPETLYNLVFNDYQKFLRGKSLIALLIRNNNRIHYHPEAFLELVAARPGDILKNIAMKVEATISN